MTEPKEKRQDTKEKGFNDEKEWAATRNAWAKEQADRIQAHADRFFMSDDDLPLSRHIILITVVLAFAAFVLWANFATLDEVTRGDGKIIPSSEVQALQSLEGGIVEEFLVKKNDDVKAGQPLLRLRDVEATSDLGANTARYYGLLASITRLQAEAEGKANVEFPDEVMQNAPESVTEELNSFRANQQKIQGQLSVLENQRDQRRQEVRELETRISDLRGVIRLARQEMEMVEPLVERGSAPKMELLQLERSLKERQTELNGVLGSLPRAKSAVQEAEARIDEVKTTAQAQAQTELSAKMIEMNSIRETLAALKERKTRTEIKSPVNGTIKDILVNTVGGVVRPGEDIVQIVPHDDQLLVEARIRPSDIAFIYPTQPAVIKITAYDFSIYGGLNGEVVDISPDTITDENGDSFYRVRLRTYETNLKRKGEILPIGTGMVASVDVLTGEKTVMDYLMKPFLKTKNEAMRER